MHLALLQVVLAAEVASSPADRAEARAQGAALLRQLESEGLRVVPPPPPRPAGAVTEDGGGDPELSAQIVEAAIAEARRQSEQFEENKALATLERAETAYRRAPQTDVKPILDLLLLRARIQFDVGRTVAASNTLRRVATLDPTHRLDPGEYEPRLLALWQNERKASQRTQSFLVVEGAGQVVVDGAPRGIAPQTLQLPAGEHFVGLATPGRTATAELVMLRNGESRVVKPPGPRDESRRDPRAAQSTELREAARAAGAQAVIEPRLRRERDRWVLDARLVDAATGRVLATASGPPEQVGSALAAALHPSRTPRAAGGDHPSDGGEAAASAPFYTRWWFWTLIGVAVAGGVVAAFTLTTGDQVGVVFHR